MQSTQDRTAKNVSSSLNGARYWCIVCTENLNSGVVVMESAKDGA
jgi:hypothetical protein